MNKIKNLEKIYLTNFCFEYIFLRNYFLDLIQNSIEYLVSESYNYLENNFR